MSSFVLSLALLLLTFQCCRRVQKSQMAMRHVQHSLVAGRLHTSQVMHSCTAGSTTAPPAPAAALSSCCSSSASVTPGAGLGSASGCFTWGGAACKSRVVFVAKEHPWNRSKAKCLAGGWARHLAASPAQVGRGRMNVQRHCVHDARHTYLAAPCAYREGGAG